MGQSQRVSAATRIDAKIVESVARGSKPDTLTPLKLALNGEPITRPPRAKRVHAWVRYRGVPVLVDAEAVAWTPRAVGIRWQAAPGDIHQAWVWASAVSEV